MNDGPGWHSPGTPAMIHMDADAAAAAAGPRPFPRVTPMLRRTFLPAAVPLVLGCLVGAAPLAPPPPATYDVVVRYRIDAFSNERIVQFNAMLKDFAARGFRRDPNEEPPPDEAIDVKATRLRGTVPAANARALLLDRHVRTILLLPAGVKLPEDANQLVRVDIELSRGLSPDRQRLLHSQTVEALGTLKFAEAVGYDNREDSRIVGTLPAGQVDAALNDLRVNPAVRGLPAPFAVVQAIRVVEVRPDLPPPSARPAEPAVPQGQEKLSSDLRDVLADAGQASKPMRLEILLANEPPPMDRTWLRPFQGAAPGIAIEGLLGTLLTATARPDQAPALAALPEVTGVRLPRLARTAVIPPGANESAALKASDLDRLHTKGFTGKGYRVAVLGADFAGWEALVGKSLPIGTRLVDLTRERHANLEPDPFPAGPGPGQGTLFAKAVAAAAPEANIVLVRVDPAAPYMLQTVARAVAGESAVSLALAQRGLDLINEQDRFARRRAQLLEERRRVLEDLRETDEAIKNREDYQKKQADFDREEREFQQVLRRHIDHEKALLGLKGVRVVASALVWDAGQPGGGASALSRFLDDRPFPYSLWIQAATAGAGQTWSGLYRDADGNGVMEFTPSGEPVPEGSWSPELNFFSWVGEGEKSAPDLPAGTRVRVTFQWREAHNASLNGVGDMYREPLMPVRLTILRQPDPAGAKRPADDLDVIAQSAGSARRLDTAPYAATYEVSVEFRVAEPGRYAIQVNGRLPESDRPATMPTLPALRRTGEIRPRITLETLEGAGRAVWRDRRGSGMSMGIPADARSVTAVAVGRAQDFPCDEMSRKPELIAPPVLEGPGLATALAAGAAASTGASALPPSARYKVPCQAPKDSGPGALNGAER